MFKTYFSSIKSILFTFLIVIILITPVVPTINTGNSSNLNFTTNYVEANNHNGNPGTVKETVKSTCSAGFFSGIDYDITQCFLFPLANVFMGTISWLVWFTGVLLNYSLGSSLGIGTFVKNTPAVKIAWGTFRDIANMFFIFILLFIAIATILQLEKYNTKALLSKLIIVALLINFSLFFTNIVIDSSNILARSFYASILGRELPPDITKIEGDGGISTQFMNGLKLQSLYDPKTKNSMDFFTDASKIFNVMLFGSVFLIVTAFVFLAASIMFVIRTGVLLFLMILSPLAFVGYILPGTSGYTKKWWNMLIGQSFFAPIFLLLIWVVLAINNGVEGSNGSGGLAKGGGKGFSDLLMGNGGDSVSVIFSFTLLIILMIASLVVAKSVAGGVATTSIGWASKASKMAGGFAAKHSVGRAFNKFAKSDTGISWADKGGLRGQVASLAGYGGNIGGFAATQKANKERREKAMMSNYGRMNDSEKQNYVNGLGEKKLRDLYDKISNDEIAKSDPSGKHESYVSDTNRLEKIQMARKRHSLTAVQSSIASFLQSKSEKANTGKGGAPDTSLADNTEKLKQALKRFKAGVGNLSPKQIGNLEIPKEMINEEVLESMNTEQFTALVDSDKTKKETSEAIRTVVTGLKDDSHIKVAAHAGGSVKMKYISKRTADDIDIPDNLEMVDTDLNKK